MGAEHGLTNVISLALATISATGVTTGVDCSDAQGIAIFTLNSAAAGSGATLDHKLTESDTQGGSYTDVPGGAFTQVGNAAACESITINMDGRKKWLLVDTTEAGTASALTSVVMNYRKNMV